MIWRIIHNSHRRTTLFRASGFVYSLRCSQARAHTSIGAANSPCSVPCTTKYNAKWTKTKLMCRTRSGEADKLWRGRQSDFDGIQQSLFVTLRSIMSAVVSGHSPRANLILFRFATEILNDSNSLRDSSFFRAFVRDLNSVHQNG